MIGISSAYTTDYWSPGGNRQEAPSVTAESERSPSCYDLAPGVSDSGSKQSMANLKPGDRICIYCKKTKHYAPRGKNSQSEFNREHVIPESFGKFKRTLTLIGSVCKACNGFFSEKLEPEITRAGVEGFLRLKHGQKSSAEFNEFDKSSLTMTINEPDVPLLHDLPLEPRAESTAITEGLTRVVAFRSEGAMEWKAFAENELDAAKSVTEFATFPAEVQLLNLEGADRQRVIDKLATKGIAADNWVDTTVTIREKVRYLASYPLNETRARAIAKVGFNYFIKVFEEVAPQVAMADDFDPLKRFILEGAIPDYAVVLQSSSPLEVECDGKRVAAEDGHIAAVGFGSYNGANAVIAKVALYNMTTFDVVLAPAYQGIVLPVFPAHCWQLNGMTCTPASVLDVVPIYSASHQADAE